MDPNLILQTVNLALQIFNTVLQDIPKEERQKAWKEWFEFWNPLLAKLK